MGKSKSAKRKHVNAESSTVEEASDAKRNKVALVAANAGDTQSCANTTRHLRPSSQLPLATQHNLLQYVQHLLEDTCQQYGMRWCAEEVQKRRWTEPQSLELQCWVKFGRKYSSSLPLRLREPQALPLEIPLFTRVAKIRYLGVHRCALELPVLLDCLTAACMFAELHEDTMAGTQLSSIHYALQSVHRDLLERQDTIQEALQHQISQIRLQQAALERQAKADMECYNSRILMDAGSKINSLLRSWQSPEVDTNVSRDRSPFSDGSDIEAVLTEAALLSSVL